MKKILILTLALFALTACGREEKLSLEEALVNNFEGDSDLNDYNLDPKEMAACVLEAISDSLPVMPTDPKRAQFFEAYAIFLSQPQSPEAANKMIEGQKDLFGSIRAAREAALSITDHIMTCEGTLIQRRDEAPPKRKHSDAPPGSQQPTPTETPPAPAAN